MNVFSQIEIALEQIAHGWTTTEKAFAMASAVIALQAETSVEIGVFAGKGLVTLALAHKYVGRGVAIGIDPYSKEASVEGQNPADREWWSAIDHEDFYQKALANIEKSEVRGFSKLIRAKSDDVEPPEYIGVLRCDGNHGEMAFRDIKRYAPRCRVGGILFLDDIGWTGGAVNKSVEWLLANNWKELYRIDDGAAYQNMKQQ